MSETVKKNTHNITTRRTRLITLSILGLLLALGLIALLFVSPWNRPDQMGIRARYQEMRTALTSNDTNAVVALIAPHHRANFNRHRFSTLNDFATPLGSRSSIMVLGNSATVWPERTWHFGVLPGGHSIEMIKVDGTWFFTGVVHID